MRFLKKYLIALLLSLPAIGIFAQEVVTGLKANADIIKKLAAASPKKSLLIPDTLELPFFEDFTGSDIWPSSELWSDNDVYINNNFAVNQISQGVATFDAINSMGLLYEEAGTFSFQADMLTSVPLDLEADPSENIYLSFFYQPQGIADPPEPQDSLVLQFYSVSEDAWFHAWKAGGTELHNFKPVIIKIADDKYLHRGFRFRFLNYASISSTLNDPAMAGNCDQWNVDYIYIDRDRSANDTIPEDVSFTLPVRSLLNTYESMPWKQFREVFLSEMGSFVGINYRNNDAVTRNVTRVFKIEDLYSREQVHNFSAGATNIEAGEWISYDANLIYTFDSDNTDSAMFRVRSILITDDFDPKINDTIDYIQVFKNYFAYDDGSAESGYGVNGQGASNAMVATRFRTFVPDSLRAVLIAFNDSYQSSNQRYFNIAVWTDNNGLPGDLLYEQEEMVDPGEEINGFMEFVLNDPLYLDGYFHIGWTQKSETFLNVSLDMNTVTEGRRHYYINGNWNESEESGSLLIRPVLGDKIIVSGIDDLIIPEPGKIRIWPNPVSDILNIDTEIINSNKDISITVYDNNGRKILSARNTSTINVSNLPQGIYFLNVGSGNKILAFNRFIKL